MENLTPALGSDSSRESAFRRVRWRLSDVVIALIPLAAVRASEAFFDFGRLTAVSRWIGLVLFIGWMLGFPLWVARRRGGPLPRLPRAASLAVEVLIAIPLLVLLWLALGIGIVAWGKITGAPVVPRSPLDRVDWTPSAPWTIVVLLVIVITSSVAEEVLFRGLVYNGVRRRMPTAVAVVLQALAFGFLHPYGIVHSILISAIGLALVAVYEWRRTLLAPILVHVFHDIAAVLVTAAVAISAANTPMLGVRGEPVVDGLRITSVTPGSGAESAGLRAGDVITVMDGYRVVDFQDLVIIVQKREVGDTVMIEFIRDGELRKTTAELRKRN